MCSKSDAELLREYADHGADRAFTEIVARHTNLVYSAALRQLNSLDMAAEITQGVFIALARATPALSREMDKNGSLAGWLCRTARNISLKYRRDEARRHNCERQAMDPINPIPESAPDWERLRPILDAAMSELNDGDYDAIVLRFFKNLDLRSVGRALGVTDDTAQKRISRALDKLRTRLLHHGISSTGAAISIVLSANAVQSAPG